MGARRLLNACKTVLLRLPRAANGFTFAVFAALFVLSSNKAVAEAEDPDVVADGAGNKPIEVTVNQRIKEILDDRIEEIVVMSERPAMNAVLFRRLYEDPLRARIREELRQLNILEEEFAWRQETVDYSSRPGRLRAGYDPRDALRAGLMPVEFKLPLDLVQPASLIGVDF